jgi:serine/threonine protein kinase
MSVSGLLEPDTVTATNRLGNSITINFIKEGGERLMLGRGGQGNVFKASHSVGKDISVKRLIIKTPSDIKEWAKSVESLYFLSSIFTRPDPNFMCFYGVVINPSNSKAFSSKIQDITDNVIFTSNILSENIVYMLYEFIDGRELDDIINESHEDIDYRRYGSELLNALVKLQNVPIRIPLSDGSIADRIAPMVHLDIKPSNIMIETATGTLKIIDLNTVCIAYNIDGNGGCDRSAFTLEYLAPEGVPTYFPELFKKGSFKNKRTMLMASDIFATGVTLYKMIMKKAAINPKRDIVPYHPMGWENFWKKRISVTKEAGEEVIELKELELKFSPDKEHWSSLIQNMVKVDYRQRPSSKMAMAKFNEIVAWETSNWREGPGSVALPVNQGGGKKRGKTFRKNRQTKSRRRNRIR